MSKTVIKTAKSISKISVDFSGFSGAFQGSQKRFVGSRGGVFHGLFGGCQGRYRESQENSKEIQWDFREFQGHFMESLERYTGSHISGYLEFLSKFQRISVGFMVSRKRFRGSQVVSGSFQVFPGIYGLARGFIEGVMGVLVFYRASGMAIEVPESL